MTQHQTTSNDRRSSPENWLEEHGDLLYKFAYLRVRDAHAAEDLVQETFVKAYANFKKFRHESSVRTWLFQIMRNEINLHFRRSKRARRHDGDADQAEEAFPMSQLLCPQLSSRQFSTAIEREEFWDVIQICFETVPEHLLETFLFRLAKPDDTIDSLCKELDVNPSNFSVRLFRTRLLLRQCLENRWMKEKGTSIQ